MSDNTEELVQATYKFAPAGLSDDNKIIFLIADDLYGDYTLALNLLHEDVYDQPADTFGVQYDFLSTEHNVVPQERQEEVVQAIVTYIVDQVAIVNSEVGDSSVEYIELPQ